MIGIKFFEKTDEILETKEYDIYKSYSNGLIIWWENNFCYIYSYVLEWSEYIKIAPIKP